LYIIDELLEAGAKIKAYDPEAMENVAELYSDKIDLVETQYEAIKNVDALAIITEWSVFRTPDFDKMKTLLTGNKVVFDGRNLYGAEQMRQHGFYYESIGRDIVNIEKEVNV